jgi:type I restriction enzyme S subunit
MSNATSHIDNKPSLRASHCEDEGRSKLKQSHPLIPALRFNEFDGYWNNQLLGNVVSKVGSGSTPSGGVQVYQKTGIPFIRSQNVTGNKLVLDNTHISESINLKMKGSIVKPHDILLNITGGSIGRSCVVASDFDIGNVNQHVCIIRLKSDYTPRFLQPFLASHKGQKLLYQGMTGSGREGINFQSIRLFKLNLPSLPEQQKIASFLSTVDEKIQQLNKKKALLVDYKKGVMQQLFSGQLRFKDENGEAYPDWKPRKMSEVLFEHKLNSTGNEVVFSVSVHKGLVNQVEHLGRVFAAKNTDNYNLVQPGDIVYTKSPTGSFPLGIIKQSKIDKNVIVSPLYGIFTPETEGLGYMFNVFFESPINVKNYLASIIQKGAKNTINITNTTFLSKKMKLPVSKEEQNRIGDFLKEIDTKISITKNQITQTQTFKKGLLQQMFV